MTDKICFRNLRHYKYQLVEAYEHPTEIRPESVVRTVGDFVVLTTDGRLQTKKGYAWDGPSGPTIDTKNFMRGSLVHDALYQLMREGLLSQEHRETADRLLREICLEDGMSRIRAWWVYRAVRSFAAAAAAPRPTPRDLVTCAP